MKRVCLPAPVTRLLNALYHELEVAEAWPAFQRERENFQSWLVLHSTFTLDDNEAAAFENLTYLWQQADQALYLELSQELAEALVQLYAVREQIRSARSSRSLAVDEGVNGALLAGQVYLSGRATREVLRPWLPVLEKYLDDAWEVAVRVGLPASERGPAAFAQGIQEWRALLDSAEPQHEACQQALSWIGWGARELDQFLGCSAPTAGHPLANLDDFEESWQGRLLCLLIPGGQRQELDLQMDDALEQWAQQLTARQNLGWARAQQIWREAETQHASRPALPEPQNELFEALGGVLEERVPDQVLCDILDYCLETAGSTIPGTAGVRCYLEDGTLAHLHRAVDELLAGLVSAEGENEPDSARHLGPV